MLLFFSMLLLCSFFRLKELFQVKNGLTTSLLFFKAKRLGRSDDAKRREKRGWPILEKYSSQKASLYYFSPGVKNESCHFYWRRFNAFPVEK